MQNNATIKLAIHPTTNDAVEKGRGVGALKYSFNSSTKEASIIGMLSRKEKSAASSLCTPHSSPQEMVLPLRLIPGKHAMPCITPIVIACQ